MRISITAAISVSVLVGYSVISTSGAQSSTTQIDGSPSSLTSVAFSPYAAPVVIKIESSPTQSTIDPASFMLILDSYEQLNHRNWDGYDAEPITPETLRYARRLLRVMPDTFGPPDIAPSGDGSIGLEWVLDDGSLHKLFLDIGPSEEWHAYWNRRGGEFGRLPGTGFDSETEHVLQSLFADLSGLPGSR